VRRVGDDPKRRERNPMLNGDPGRHMRFHVDRNGTGLLVQPSLCVSAGNGHIGSRNIAK